MLRIVIATAALVLAVSCARADPVADFYKGQQVKLIVATAPAVAMTSMDVCSHDISGGTFPAIQT